MQWLYKNWVFLSIIFLLFLGYFLLRLPNLTIIPVFADEAIYIRWAQVMRAEPTLRFLPLSDGKTPLFMWMMIPFIKVFSDPLFAGRFLSVLAGVGTLLGVMILGWRFFNRFTALWGGLLIVVTPYIVFFDRMALVDSMLSAFSIWCLVVAMLLIQTRRLDLAMILGGLMGGAMLTKTPGIFNIWSLPLTAILINWRSKKRYSVGIKVVFLWIVAIVIAFGIFNILRLGPGFGNLDSRNQDYVHPINRLLEYPVDPLIPHIKDFTEWSMKLIGIPITLLVIFGVMLSFIKRNKYAIAIALWAGFPLVVEMMLLKTFTARYVLFSIPPFLLLGAWGLDNLLKGRFSHTLVKVMALGVILIWPLYVNFWLLINPQMAPLPVNERRGYLEDWTAGYGLKEIAQLLDEESKKGMIVVGTEGYFGTLPEGLQIYLDKNREVIIKGGKATISAEIRQAVLDHPTYFVANQSRFSVIQPDVELLQRYPKAENPDFAQDAMLLFKVKKEIGTRSGVLK